MMVTCMILIRSSLNCFKVRDLRVPPSLTLSGMTFVAPSPVFHQQLFLPIFWTDRSSTLSNALQSKSLQSCMHQDTLTESSLPFFVRYGTQDRLYMGMLSTPKANFES